MQSLFYYTAAMYVPGASISSAEVAAFWTGTANVPWL